jgi:hypothetical protein
MKQHWQDSDPRAPGGGVESLDNRVSHVGRTTVYSDRFGPYKFVRGGVEVDCICDGTEVCAFHFGVRDAQLENAPSVIQDAAKGKAGSA